ncbi:hypothetical protein GGR54DRAFT_634894 [Hypoxylon sp. NC1633]|nr:hypothetical protein GGR54DRAFT_634894 [Hypoxylon sp. NC1633]
MSNARRYSCFPSGPANSRGYPQPPPRYGPNSQGPGSNSRRWNPGPSTGRPGHVRGGYPSSPRPYIPPHNRGPPNQPTWPTGNHNAMPQNPVPLSNGNHPGPGTPKCPKSWRVVNGVTPSRQKQGQEDAQQANGSAPSRHQIVTDPRECLVDSPTFNRTFRPMQARQQPHNPPPNSYQNQGNYQHRPPGWPGPVPPPDRVQRQYILDEQAMGFSEEDDDVFYPHND